MGDADERIGTATTGNTITDSFQAVGESADENLSVVRARFNEIPPIVEDVDAALASFSSRAGGYFESAIGGADDLYDELQHLGTGRSFVAGISTEVDRLAGKLASIFAQLQAAQGAAGAGGGGSNTTNITTVTQNNTIQSQAQNASANQQLLNELGGGG